MALLSEEQLIWSPVVANSAMNRLRGANRYAQALKLAPESYLGALLRQFGQAAWLDLCCGAGNALRQTAEHFQRLGAPGSFILHGVDLVDAFAPVPPVVSGLTFEVASVVDWTAPR
ncbi:hypothetical protein [Hymenobacter sp. CRA2]|uniref:hypothetical protein n=1 Tax=Hymenobacter sp. CRA2 TaxID=1955620 RepID=UPI00098FAAD2|nr:hypothetical protein [Hymenobacter sp. CRA2]OON68507.1 hypothetical protein B0919_12745 [Hymenobacter sp. CRA2]